MNAAKQENQYLHELRKAGHDDVADIIEKGHKSWYDSLERLSSSIAENYSRGKIGVHAHLKVRVNGLTVPSSQYCIHFQSKISGSESEKIAHFNIVQDISKNDTPFPVLDGFNGVKGKLAMLVDSIQIVDLPEDIRGSVSPSCVRLQCLDNFLGVGVNAPDFTGVNIVFRLRNSDGEFGTFDLLSSHCWSVFDSKSHCQMVEGGPHVEKTISNNETPLLRDDTDTKDSASSCETSIGYRLRKWFRVWFVDNAVGISLDPRSDLVIEALDVFTCPI